MREGFNSLLTSPSRSDVLRLGTVVDCNTSSYTVDVKLTEVDTLTDVPVLNLYGASHGKDLAWLSDLRGALVALVRIQSQYYVMGTVPISTRSANLDNVSPALEPGYGGENTYTYSKAAHAIHSSGRPTDFLPGDKILRSSSGAMLGIFMEGISLLKASPLCQIVLSRFRDLLRIVSRRVQVFSDFGELHVEHTPQGRVGTHLMGGASFAEETHPSQAKWTVQVWVGDDPANPDNRLHIRVNDKDNGEYVTLELDQLGNMVLDTSKDRIATHGQDEKIDVARDRSVTVGNNEDLSVGVDQTESVGSNVTRTVGGNVSETIGGSRSISVAGTSTSNVSGSQTSNISGTSTTTASSTLTIISSASVIIQAPKIKLN